MAALLSFLVFLAANLVAGSSGAVYRPGAWYESLNKPYWIPPNWAFPAAWGVIFTLNAIAGWLVWQAAESVPWLAMGLYSLNLVFNALWSALFFGERRMDLALIDAITLLVSVIAVMLAFASYSQVAVLLLTPYLTWVALAVGLNWKMIELNPPKKPTSVVTAASSHGEASN